MKGKRLSAWVMSLAMAFGIMPAFNLTAFAEDGNRTVFVGGTELTVTDDATYAVTDDGGNVTTNDADAENYNVKFEIKDSVPTLTLRGATIKNAETFDVTAEKGKGHGIYAEGDLTIVGEKDGEKVSTVIDATADGIYVKGNLTLKGTLGDINGSDYLAGTEYEIENTRKYAAAYCTGIRAEGNITIDGEVGDIYGGSGIFAKNDITVSGAVGDVCCNIIFPIDSGYPFFLSGNGIYSEEGNITISGSVGDILKADENDPYNQLFTKCIYAGGKYDGDTYVSGGTITVTGTVGNINAYDSSGSGFTDDKYINYGIEAYELIVGEEHSC